MERLFVRILNITLLGAGFIALLIAAVTAAFAVLTLTPSMLAKTSNSYLSLHYTPVSEVSGSVPSPQGDSGSTDSAISPDIDAAAADLCKAKSEFVDRVSNRQLSFDPSKCKGPIESDAETTWGDRELNFLKESASYWHALLSDSQLLTEYSEHARTSFGLLSHAKICPLPA
jgi:hypothetical protein